MKISVNVSRFRAKENILSIKYVTWLRWYLWPLGFWPGDDLNEKMPVFIILHRNYIVFQGLWLSSAVLNFIYKHFDTLDFILKGYVYLIFLLSLLTWLRVFITTRKPYGTVVKSFLCTLHLANRELHGRLEQQVLNDIERICHMFTLFSIITSFVGESLYIASPMYLNYKNGFFSGQQKENTTYNCIVCFTIPKLVDTYEFGIISTIITVYLTYPCTISICGIDLLLILMALHIIGNIHVLRKRLETLSPLKKNLKNIIFDEEIDDVQDDVQSVSSLAFTKEENQIVHKKLVDSIKYQNMIIMFTEMMSDVFGPMLEFNHVFHLTACCLLLLECSAGTDAIFRFGPLTAIVFTELILFSVVFEIVATQGEKLINSVYFTPWDRMDTRNRRTVHIMLLRAQRPICITGMGLTTVGVTTMAQILKATASYYALLSSNKE